jgi:hypothetical protein
MHFMLKGRGQLSSFCKNGMADSRKLGAYRGYMKPKPEASRASTRLAGDAPSHPYPESRQNSKIIYCTGPTFQ